MGTTIRSTITFVLLLILCGAALAQGQSGNGASAPTVTGTATTDGVRYVSLGEVQQTRLQVFSPDGAQVFDSGFRSGNLLDWQLADQQGSRVKDGSYLFVVTVRDFSARTTQKYGTAVIEREQVYLEQTNRAELSAQQQVALESSKESNALSPIDRVGAAGLNRATTNVVVNSSDSSSSSNSKTDKTDSATVSSTPSLAGTGSQNKVAKWIDNLGNLGDSSIFDNGGNIGIGTTTPANRLDVVRGTSGSMAKSFYEAGSFESNADIKVGIYTSSSNPGDGADLMFGQTTLKVGNNYPGLGLQYIYGSTPASNQMRFNYVERNSTGAVVNYAANLLTLRGDGAVTLNPVTSGVAATPRFGIGNSNPTEALDVSGNVRVQGAGNGIIFSDGSKQTSAAAGINSVNNFTVPQVFSAGLSAGGTQVTNVGNPVNATDATNKAYVDANTVKFVPGAEQLSVGDANGTAPMINLRGGSTCCSGPGGHTPAWFKVFQNGSFVATGNLGIGVSPMQGKGYRTSWDSYKGAFRSGYADNEWDDATVGFFSWAGGSNSTAEGLYALAFGDTNQARSTSSIVFGSGNEVKGAAGFAAGAGNRVCDTYGVAFGNKAISGSPILADGKCDPDTFNIRGLAAVAIGYNVTASMDHTMALGKFASNNGFSGTFIWSDGSATASADTFRNTANNEFAARATGGFRFRTNLGGTTGCNLPAGSGVFNCTSSRTTKENFLNISGEDVLKKLRNVQVSSWNYISEGKNVRHIGPMAEDFYQAFGLGTGNTSIGVQDLAGVNLAATKALDERTAELQQKTVELEKKTAEVEQLRNRVSVLEERLANIEKVMQKSQGEEGAKAQ